MSGALAQSCVSVLRSIRTIQPRCPSVCALQQRTSLPSRQGKSSGLLSSGETTTKQLRQQRFLTVKAVDVSGPGTVDFPLITSMQEKIKEQLKAQEVSVKDAYGDGRHVSIDVVAEAFEGQSRVNRQRMVYKAIWEELQSTVHAVDQLRTQTPAEAAGASKDV
ncbi:unnamed protein product [Sphagnum troendelagicum]|uniref:Bola-like protein n=2 Tax=Sphagnum TaxID=13804 RepID=A0ABP0V135_9BRYO